MYVFHTIQTNVYENEADCWRYPIKNNKEGFDLISELIGYAKSHNLKVFKRSKWFECLNEKGEAVEWFGIDLE